jgi:hypothetical protein
MDGTLMKVSARVAATIAGAAAAAALGLGTAHADIVQGNPGGGPGKGCVLFNGTVLTDGQSYSTSIGTLITCKNGQVCRESPSKGTAEKCRVEAATRSPA